MAEWGIVPSIILLSNAMLSESFSKVDLESEFNPSSIPI